MDWPTNYVYIPMWLLVLLVFLASGALQYALIGAVRWEVRHDREQPIGTSGPKVEVITLDQIRKEKSGS